MEYAEATHRIIEIDRDYRCMTGSEYMKFDSDEAAREYARAKSWSGYDYYVERKDGTQVPRY